MTDHPEEFDRLSAVPSPFSEFERAVEELHLVPPAEAPHWLDRLQPPEHWLASRYTGTDPHRPWRIAVCGPQTDGGWDACETLSVYGFEGPAPAPEVMTADADRVLRGLGSQDTETEMLWVSGNGSHVVRCTGHFAAAGLWIWGQHNFFVLGAEHGGPTFVLLQCIYVESSRFDTLRADAARLFSAAQAAFMYGVVA